MFSLFRLLISQIVTAINQLNDKLDQNLQELSRTDSVQPDATKTATAVNESQLQWVTDKTEVIRMGHVKKFARDQP